MKIVQNTCDLDIQGKAIPVFFFFFFEAKYTYFHPICTEIKLDSPTSCSDSQAASQWGSKPHNPHHPVLNYYFPKPMVAAWCKIMKVSWRFDISQFKSSRNQGLAWDILIREQPWLYTTNIGQHTHTKKYSKGRICSSSSPPLPGRQISAAADKRGDGHRRSEAHDLDLPKPNEGSSLNPGEQGRTQ